MKPGPVIVISSVVILILTFFGCIITGITEEDVNIQKQYNVANPAECACAVAGEPSERPSEQFW